MSERRVTIKDVAQRAGVSIGAVSRVLHGRASTIRVSEATSEVIRKAAKDLQYKPNRSAQSLRSGRTKTLTVAAPFDILFGSNSYFASILDGIVQHAAKSNYTICLSKSSLSGSTSFEESKGKFDGIIWLGAPPAGLIESDSKLEDLPQVAIHLDDAALPAKVVNIKADEVQAIINYVGHLRVNDFSKIGLFARSGDMSGLLGEKKLADLSKRLAVDFQSYKSPSDLPGLIEKSGVTAAVVWNLDDAAEVTAALKGAKKVKVACVVPDTSSDTKGNFAFPINELCRTAVETVIAKIETPSAAAFNKALPIPHPE